MPNFGYHAARLKGLLSRRLYLAALPAIVKNRVTPPTMVPIDVFSYSGESSLPEQILSIRSFIKHAGRPNRFVVMSDGSHSSASIDLLKRSDPSVSVIPAATRIPQGLPNELYSYLTTHPTGKQLSLIMSLPDEVPALYCDSDVLFFPGAAKLSSLIAQAREPALYLPDCQLAGDERLLRNAAERNSPVNTGLILIKRPMDWHLGISRFLDLHGSEPTFFTNQTITHLTMHANGAKALCTMKYVLSLEDQFIFSDQYADKGIAARHYVNPVRHKMWCTL